MTPWLSFIFLVLAASAFGYVPEPNFVSTDLTLAPGSHTLAATAHYPVGQFSKTTNSTFTVFSTATNSEACATHLKINA